MRAVCNIPTPKPDTHRTRFTAGANLIDYPGEVSTPTLDLTTLELHVNIAISDAKSIYICMEIQYFHLNNQIDRDEYIIIHISMIPQEFVDKYNITEKSHNGYIYARETKGTYGIPQVRQIAHDALVKHLEPYGYQPSSKTSGLWKQNSQSINVSLVVDDFGAKYLGKEHASHMKAALETKYKVTTYWEGKLYIEIALNWDYDKGMVQLYIPIYKRAVLHSFQQDKPKQP